MSPLNKHQAVVQTMAKEAYRGCGQVYELYERQFSEAVEQYLTTVPDGERPMVLQAAEKEGYIPVEELTDPEEQGLCKHYLDPWVCPAGCGDL